MKKLLLCDVIFLGYVIVEEIRNNKVTIGLFCDLHQDVTITITCSHQIKFSNKLNSELLQFE